MFNNFLKSLTFKNDYSNMTIRKTKSFNKSRYSRNRQYYRTGVYWCLWLNIILVFVLYYAFYRYTLKFGYVFIFYVIGMLLGLLSYFSKNYFLGFLKSMLVSLETVAYYFVLACLELRLALLHVIDDTTCVVKRFCTKIIKKLKNMWK
jgi:hypothetical protein